MRRSPGRRMGSSVWMPRWRHRGPPRVVRRSVPPPVGTREGDRYVRDFVDVMQWGLVQQRKHRLTQRQLDALLARHLP